MSTARLRQVAIYLLLLGGCAAAPERSDDGPAGGPAPVDASPPTGGDALPVGAISFFKTPVCPIGWFPYGPAAGRLLLPSVGAAGVGAATGEPLRSGEDRAHSHKLTAALVPRPTSFIGATGGGNRGVAGAATAALATTTDPATTGLPYLQLLACQKVSPARPARRPLPRGLLAFFAQPTCPDGWAQAGATQGRFLVGLPEGGVPEVSFGGAVLSSTDRRAHGHAAQAELSLPSYGIALASGCCASGYAQSGKYTIAAAAEPSDGGLPFLQLLQCQKL